MLMMVAGVPWLAEVAPSRGRALELGQDDRTVQVTRMVRRGGGGRVGLSVTDIETTSDDEVAVSGIDPLDGSHQSIRYASSRLSMNIRVENDAQRTAG